MKLLGEPKSIDMEDLKDEIHRLLKNPPSGNEYYTKEGVTDTSKPENLKIVQERYKSDLQFMLEKL